MSDNVLQAQAADAANNILRGPSLGPDTIIGMAKGWDFPAIVRTPDQAVAYLQAMADCMPKDSGYVAACAQAQGIILEQAAGGTPGRAF